MSGCPVDHGNAKYPIAQAAAASAATSGSSHISDLVGDDFTDALDDPVPGQRIPLPRERTKSNIPKASTINAREEGATWEYPSEQRFFSALKRKGWNPREEDMPFVVSIHNAINEQTWKKILEYEDFHKAKCPDPKLLKFRGRPDAPSPKSRLLTALGYKAPFDRHDWTVDRCGKQVTYIIDFYQGKAHPSKPVSVHLDVRPELTFGGLIDRLRMTWKEWTSS